MADLVEIIHGGWTPGADADKALGLRVFCPQHETTHTLPLADVERALYALAVGEVTAYSIGYGMGEAGQDRADDDLECPLVTVVRSLSSVGFLEHVEECIAERIAR